MSSDSPETHKFIKEKEKMYIVSKTAETILSSKEKKVNNHKFNNIQFKLFSKLVH